MCSPCILQGYQKSKQKQNKDREYMPQAPPPNKKQPPYGGMDENRIDINLIAMLLWQSLLTGVAVTVSQTGWYLPSAGAGEMGLQYGLITFGFLCMAMVLFHVGGIRDSLSMRAEFSQENRYDKWLRSQQRLQERRLRKDMQYTQANQMSHQMYQQMPQQTFGLPTTEAKDEEEPPHTDV
tara:strand:- start:73514 stop:74053 length:540 start_codon:yes stop_codon:yes gene_type:complete